MRNMFGSRAIKHHAGLILRRLLVLCGLLALAQCAAHAEDLYLSQAGGGSGTSCSSALASSFFNSSGNWDTGTGKISPGDTVHLCGTITTALTFQGSGTSGSPITLKFEPGAKMSAPTWGSGQAILIQNGQSWITIDGGSTCGWVNQAEVPCNGIIEATDNGSSPTYGHSDNDAGIFGRYVNNVTVKNMAVNNLFIKNTADYQAGGDAIHVDGSNILLANNVVHDSQACLTIGRQASTTASNGEMRNNVAYHCNFTYASGDNGDGAILNGLLIHDNEGYDWQNWDDPIDNYYHHNCVIMYLTNDHSVVTGLQIYNNYCHGDTGAFMTAHIFLDGEGNGSAGSYTGALVFNNVLEMQTHGADVGVFNPKALGGNPAVAFYNNTIYMPVQIGERCVSNYGANINMKNNVFWQCGQMYWANGGSLVASDYNDFYGMTNFGPDTSGSYITLNQWQSVSGQDSHSISSAPNLNTSTFVPSAGSPLVKAAVNLDSIGSAALMLDKAGLPRPTGTLAWDIGAYTSSVSSSSAPNPPIGLVATVN